MRILAVDTTSEHGSVAVVENGVVLRRGADHHREPAIRAGCCPRSSSCSARCDAPLRSVEGVRGRHGSGLLHRPADRPQHDPGPRLWRWAGRAWGSAALDALASRAVSSAGAIVAWIDAFRGEVYAAIYDARGEPTSEPEVGAPAALLARAPPRGGIPGLGSDSLSRVDPCPRSRRPLSARQPRISPSAVGRLGERRLLAGKGAGPETLRPSYVRGVDIRKAAP